MMPLNCFGRIGVQWCASSCFLLGGGVGQQGRYSKVHRAVVLILPKAVTL